MMNFSFNFFFQSSIDFKMLNCKKFNIFLIFILQYSKIFHESANVLLIYNIFHLDTNVKRLKQKICKLHTIILYIILVSIFLKINNT